MPLPQVRFRFSYGLSRPFPFKWFTPVALCTILVFAAVFSFLNYLSTGFVLDVELSNNCNATVADEKWLRGWPDFIFNMRPTCQTATIPVGSQFFTNQTALLYKLEAVWQYNRTSADINVLPSLTYANNVLENCSISMIEIELQNYDRTAKQVAYSMYGEVVRTFATCAISTEGPMWFNISQLYDYVPETISDSNAWGERQFLGTNFLERNERKKPALWWGESLMSTYWGIVSGAMESLADPSMYTPVIRKGTLAFRLQDARKDITSLDFFEFDYRYIIDQGNGAYGVIYPGTYDQQTGHRGNDLSQLIDAQAYPNVWMWADRLAKSAYSTILVDLGQQNLPNIITDDAVLYRYTEVFDSVASENEPFIANARPGPSIASYDGSGDPLEISPSVITSEYLCQVPKQKSVLNLLVSILVADLVFLQGIWWLLLLGAEYLLRKRPTSQYCEGCLKYLIRQGEVTDLPTDDNDTGHISLHSLNSQSAADRNGWHWRSTSEQYLIPRPAFQRQVTDS